MKKLFIAALAALALQSCTTEGRQFTQFNARIVAVSDTRHFTCVTSSKGDTVQCDLSKAHRYYARAPRVGTLLEVRGFVVDSANVRVTGYRVF
jgi:hypothetical protein